LPGSARASDRRAAAHVRIDAPAIAAPEHAQGPARATRFN
jgi:hypothetical protein